MLDKKSFQAYVKTVSKKTAEEILTPPIAVGPELKEAYAYAERN